MTTAERILITGCNGFVGRHLAEHLLGKGAVVFGIDIGENPWTERLAYVRMDMTNSDKVVEFVKTQQINLIYHLAAIANPRDAQKDPQKAIRSNIDGTVSFLECCRMLPDARLLVVGSSEEYKRKEEAVVAYRESDSLESHNIYSLTKICAEIIGKEYVKQYGTKVFFTRSFNHTGPGQKPGYVVSDFARQCVEIAKGKRAKVIQTGNIDLSRDFLDVRDVVRAYELILKQGVPGEAYNVCSGNAYLLRDLLSSLISYTSVPGIEIRIMPELIRSGEPERLYGINEKLSQGTGWKREIPIEQTLFDTFEYWKMYVEPS